MTLGKAVTTLGIALAIAVIFQVFILRNPARRTLRKALAEVTFSMLSYYSAFFLTYCPPLYHVAQLCSKPMPKLWSPLASTSTDRLDPPSSG